MQNKFIETENNIIHVFNYNQFFIFPVQLHPLHGLFL